MRAWKILTWSAVVIWLWLFCTLKVFASENEKTITMLAKLVQAEAGNQSIEGKRFVVDVVLNRVDNEAFPETIDEVIYQNNQFSVIKNGAFDKAEPTEEDYAAVLLELGSRTDEEILYFTAGWYGTYGTKAFQCGNHYFCKE